jgi:NAD(P)H-hydrate epimerase
MKVLTPEEMRAVDSRAIEGMGVPGLQLMENAGRAVAELVMDRLPHADSVVVLAGRGNNGGDGLVAARHLAENGRDVLVLLLRGGKELSKDCQANLDELPQSVKVVTIDNGKELGDAVDVLSRIAAEVGSSPIRPEAVLVDALLGTGARGQVEGLIADVLIAASGLDWPTVACDIPSGIDGTDGSYLGAGIPAVATVTMALPKTGLYLNAGVEYSGDVVVADVGFPDEAVAPAVASMETIEAPSVARLFAGDRGRPDEKTLHKGDFGRVLVAAGSRGMLGANELCCRAALRVGCGMAVGAVPETEYPILASRTGPEIMTAPVKANKEHGCFSPDGIEDLKDWIEWADVLAFGPGFSRHQDALEFARRLVKAFPDTPHHQLVIDADGLQAFADEPGLLSGRKRAPIITPHPGEFASLTASHDLPRGTLERLRAYAELSDSVVVLKGARTLIATPRETPGCPVAVNVESGNPGMATAGSGDVLTGMLAGLSGQTTIAWDPFQIACAGVFLHGFAGDLAASRLSRQALIAGDIIDYLPRAFRRLQRMVAGPVRVRRGRRRR